MNLENIRLRFLGGSSSNHPDHENCTLASLEKAKRELEAAKEYFNSVSAPELIDHAVYLMEAAQRKLTYLIKQAKEENISNNSIYVN